MYFYIMIPGSKGINPHELAHGSAKHGTLHRYQSRGLLTPTSYNAI